MTKARRSFTDEFKREAVALLQTSGRPLMQIASELGIQPSMLLKQGKPQRAARGIRKRLKSLCSLFKQGLRFLRRCIAGFGKIPRFWEAWAN